jgi:hypothetical protein
MALYDGFAPPVNSTGAGTASNPASTGVVIANIDSTQLRIVTGSLVAGAGRAVLCRVDAFLGGNSSMAWRVEQSVSSTITDAPKMSAQVFTPAHQTGVYPFTIMLEPGDYVRARVSDTGTGTFSAFLQVNPLS